MNASQLSSDAGTTSAKTDGTHTDEDEVCDFRPGSNTSAGTTNERKSMSGENVAIGSASLSDWFSTYVFRRPPAPGHHMRITVTYKSQNQPFEMSFQGVDKAEVKNKIEHFTEFSAEAKAALLAKLDAESDFVEY